MKEQLATLVELQKIETESDHINSLLNNVSDKVSQFDASLAEFEQSFNKEIALKDELQKKYRSYESDLEMNNNTIQKNQATLNSIKTNKEYQAMLKGIEELKKKNSKLEEEMLVLLNAIEDAEKKIEIRKKELQEFKQDIKNKKKVVQKEAEQGKDKLIQLEGDKNTITSKISADIMDKFLVVKQQVTGPAVVPVRGLVCEGCNMNIPPQICNELQLFESLKFCPFCNRILYKEEEEK